MNKKEEKIQCEDCKKIIYNKNNVYLYHGMLHCEKCAKRYIKSNKGETIRILKTKR